MRYIILTLLWTFSLSAFSSEVNVAAGEFSLRDISVETATIEITIIQLNDSDPKYAPSTSLDFYSDSETIIFSVGIMKLDGEQGITAFYRLGEPTNPAEQGAIVSDLELGQSYSIYYAYLGNDRLNLSVAGRDFSIDIGAKPTKVTHMVSGMVAIVE